MFVAGFGYIDMAADLTAMGDPVVGETLQRYTTM